MSLAEAFLGLSFLVVKRIKPPLRFFPLLTVSDYMKKCLRKKKLEISEPLFYRQIKNLESQSNMTFQKKDSRVSVRGKNHV